MKKKLAAIFPLLLIYLFSNATGPVDDTVLKSFNESFKEAKEVSWTQSKDLYMVHFVKDEIRYNVTYDKKGNFVSSIRYYTEDKLPMYILFKMKKKFKGRSVYGVTETLDETGVEYHITMEDKNYWWIVKVTSQEFVEITSKLLKNK